jgi:hypothetical protein
MEKVYEQLHYSLSDEDLHKLLPNVTQIAYADLKKYQSISQLLPKQRDAVILFVERQDNVGHWQALVRIGNDILFFDSYGERPDKALLWAPKQLRRELGQKIPMLSLLLNRALTEGFVVKFNEFSFQSDDPNITTCGRWAVLFISYCMSNTDASLTDFYNFVMSECKKREVTPDILVTTLIR